MRTLLSILAITTMLASTAVMAEDQAQPSTFETQAAPAADAPAKAVKKNKKHKKHAAAKKHVKKKHSKDATSTAVEPVAPTVEPAQ